MLSAGEETGLTKHVATLHWEVRRQEAVTINNLGSFDAYAIAHKLFSGDIGNHLHRLCKYIDFVRRIDGPYCRSRLESRHETGVTDENIHMSNNAEAICRSSNSSNRKTVCVVTDRTLVNLSTWTSLSAHQDELRSLHKNSPHVWHQAQGA
jgi:hypothetical protein